MTPDEILVVGRVVERLLTCLFAGLSLTFGWNLFRVGVLSHQSAALAASGWRVELKRVGPGIFFALFGSVVLAVDLHSTLTFGSNENEQTSAANSVVTAGTRVYAVAGDQTVAKQWVASINTILSVATADKFQTNAEKQAIARAAADLTSLRTAVMVNQFGSDRISEYQSKKDRFNLNPLALTPAERGRVGEIAGWMKETRTLE